MKLSQEVLAKVINHLMWNKGKFVSTAESCSCGRLAALLGEYPGSSAYFKGGIVTYTDEMKAQYLGVSPTLLAEKTAVCEEVAVAMVEGSLKMFGTDYAVAMTGVAGPTGADANNPVGSIWMAWGKKGEIYTYHQLGNEGRDRNVDRAVEALLGHFLHFLKKDLQKE